MRGPATREHARHEGTQPIHHAVHVHIEQPAPFGIAVLPHAARHQHPGVVAQHLHATVGIKAGSQCLHGGGVANVQGLHGEARSPTIRQGFSGKTLQRLGIHIGANHLQPGGTKSQGQGTPDATRSASDQRGLSEFQLHKRPHIHLRSQFAQSYANRLVFCPIVTSSVKIRGHT